MRRLTSLITLVAYVGSTFSPFLAYAGEEPPAPHPTGVVSSPAESAEGAKRVDGGGLSTAGDRSSAVAVGDGPKEGAGAGENSSGSDSGAEGSGDGTSSGSTDGGDGKTETPSTDTLGLPSGDDKSGVTGNAISIPQGSGSIQGMGESFSAQLSTGIATFSVPFSLPKARGGAQPSLGLSYSSGGGNGPVGQGWSVGVPFIARQTDRGLPKYDDRANFHPEQDTFVFNGGQELVPICTVGSDCPAKILAGEVMPTWANGYQYFRPRVEGSFLRFFWSPDHKTWVVQDKSGTTMELGKPRNGSDESAIEKNPDRANELFKWHLSRQFDQHGSSAAPLNVVLYRYASFGNQAYVTDIFDTPPVTGGSPTDASFAGHTHLQWDDRPDVTESYRSGYRILSSKRLARVDVTSKTFLGSVANARRQVRRYHLSYSPDYHRSLLTSVQVEGRCSGNELEAPSENSSQELAASTNCPRLPPMTFAYTKVDGYQPDGTPDPKRLPGEMPFDGRVKTLTGSPKHSLDEALTDFFDINSDGLPDLLVTAPGLYSNGHAVFFNGAKGAQGFGGFENMGVSGVLNAGPGDIKLSNLNLSPQDYDGDGRINLLHMPKVKTYAAYDPIRKGGQWMWRGHEVTSANGQAPKIDFGKDTRDTQVMDVNYDGLVDVVVSTGTEYQTFFSLGTYPNGDGQFGEAERTGATTASIKNTPVSTCVPHSGTPVYFGDSDVKLGDMNGDGIADLVRVRRGNIQYWPGRGNGFWGTGDRDDCKKGTFGANRYVAMNAAPYYSDIEGSTLKLDDVNGDGLDDLVQINFDSVDIYLNVDGTSWTVRHILDHSPYHAGYANRVRLTDVNGSGTPDIVWGDSSAYKYIDLAGGQKPYLLIGVENGLGKSTTIEYSTSSDEMRAAEALAACGSDPDPWKTAWCKKAPMVSNIVKRVTERDNITIHGRPPAAYVTEYDYRDPVFEGRQREFRGYSRARARRLGDANSPTDVSESIFLLGECLGADGTPWDGDNLEHECAPKNRWKDNAQEALKGLPVETHKFDLAGVHLSSTFNNYRVRTLYEGLDGRLVRHAFLAETDTVLYDTDAGASATTRAKLARKGFIDEGKPSSATSTSVAANTAVSDVVPSITLPSGGAHLRTRSEVDLFGNQLRSIDFGCVAGAACPVAEDHVRAEETLTKETEPALISHESGWLYRTKKTRVLGSSHTGVRGLSEVEYDSLGRPTQSKSTLEGTLDLDREEASSILSGGASDGEFVATATKYDSVGNAIRSRGQNGRCAEVAYDAAYGTFATTESIFTNGTGAVTDVDSPCGGAALISTAAYDRGLGVVTVASDLNLRDTKAVYDGFGRIVALHKPSATKDETEDDTYSTAPSVTMEYRLPGCEGCAVGSLPIGSKHSLIHTRAQDGTDETDTTNYLESYAYVDGFGRTLVTLAEADPTEDGAGWVAGSLLEWDQKSAVSKKYMPFFFDGDPEAFNYSSDVTTPYGRQRYDAFGRQVQTYDLDGTITLQSKYHALSTDLWDAADLYAGPHQHSYASERKDGHGRSIETTERFRDSGAMESRFVRTLYLPTGEPELIARVRGSDSIVRWMRYDSLGRMVLNVEPNTTKGFVADLDANAESLASMRAWRYRYNLAGDLIGTSDARGCGQNFFYDSAGRIKGEDYAPCEAHQAAYTPASDGNDVEDLEVAYFYDSAAPFENGALASLKPSDWTPVFTAGRAIAVLDRASASFTTFDGRGRTTTTHTRVARPKEPGAAAPTLANRYAPRVYARTFKFDAADREISATTGVEELRTATNEPKLTEFLAPGAAAGAGSTVTTTYTKRGTVKKSGSSYGTLISDIDRTADGLVTKVQYGDAAGTATAYLYDERRRISSVQTYRGPPATAWTTNPSSTTEPTQQLVLQDEDFSYDVVGNPVEIRDWRDPVDWPDGAKPVSKKIEYDDLYRATKIDYVYSNGDDTWKSPFEAENNDTSSRAAKPSPHVSFSKRVLRQTFEYDWVGNTDKTTDNENGFYDRSLGVVTNDVAGSKPYQLKHAELSGTKGGAVDAKYDDAGNMVRMDLRRDGPCLGGTCSQIYDYQWDEVGRLVRARRWDVAPAALNGTLPGTAPAADLRYAYDAGDQRVLRDAVDNAGVHSYTVYVFETLEFRRAEYGAEHADTVAADSDYEVSHWTLSPYLLAHGVRLARLAYEDVGVPSGSGGMSSAGELHVFFELGDHLGSTSVVLDKATGELVERSTFEGYGATESDYRPGRWKNFREDYKFTGKEEDVEVGLQYFGKRFLNAYLGRWISADPLAVHAPGKADLNVYAYVKGSVLKNVDPLGLDPPKTDEQLIQASLKKAGIDTNADAIVVMPGAKAAAEVKARTGKNGCYVSVEAKERAEGPAAVQGEVLDPKTPTIASDMNGNGVTAPLSEIKGAVKDVNHDIWASETNEAMGDRIAAGPFAAYADLVDEFIGADPTRPSRAMKAFASLWGAMGDWKDGPKTPDVPLAKTTGEGKISKPTPGTLEGTLDQINWDLDVAAGRTKVEPVPHSSEQCSGSCATTSMTNPASQPASTTKPATDGK